MIRAKALSPVCVWISCHPRAFSIPDAGDSYVQAWQAVSDLAEACGIVFNDPWGVFSTARKEDGVHVDRQDAAVVDEVVVEVAACVKK